MEKGNLIEDLVQKNIEQIDFYANEENRYLNEICTKLDSGSNSYKSKNTSLLLDNISNFKDNIEPILTKRKKYSKTLNDVIEQYHMLSDMTRQKFEGEI